ncbi:MAG: hypothetical protein U0521_26755 [Anaerolineae bacterium]
MYSASFAQPGWGRFWHKRLPRERLDRQRRQVVAQLRLLAGGVGDLAQHVGQVVGDLVVAEAQHAQAEAFEIVLPVPPPGYTALVFAVDLDHHPRFRQ